MTATSPTFRSLVAAGLLAAAFGFGPAPAAAGPPPAGTDIVPARQDVPWWLVPDGRDRDRWDRGWHDDDRRDRRRHRARERCLDRDPISFWGHWDWDHGECRWRNGRPER
jgi:hypothetical protein